MRQRGSAATHRNGCRPAFEPSPEHIARECAEIRSTWTPQEVLSRLRSDLRPKYRTALGHRAEMQAEAYEGHCNSHERLMEAGR